MYSTMQDFESLLRQQEENKNHNVTNDLPSSIEKMPKKRLQADNAVDIDGAILLISKIVTKALKKYNVEFVPDEGQRIIYDHNIKIDHPYIFYQILENRPTKELKPRVRKITTEDRAPYDESMARQGSVYGIRLRGQIQFNIIACDYLQATEVMKAFEEVLFNYTSYFKRNGVAEFIFMNRFTDRNYDVYRQSVSVRSLQYMIETERNYAEFGSDMSDINIS